MQNTLRFYSKNWDNINWKNLISYEFLIPEKHYWQNSLQGLCYQKRVHLNQLCTLFSCELFIVFEEFLVNYIQKKIKSLPSPKNFNFSDFIAEEKIHQKAFDELFKISQTQAKIRLSQKRLKWNWLDKLIIRLTPRISFFLLANLFEEITVAMVPAMEKNLKESHPLVLSVMKTHAEEEKRHIALDRFVIRSTQKHKSKINLIFQCFLTLPVLLYINTKINLGWKKAAKAFCKDYDLSHSLRKKIIKRHMSDSDYLGIKTFLKNLKSLRLPGAKILQLVLEKQIQKYE